MKSTLSSAFDYNYHLCHVALPSTLSLPVDYPVQYLASPVDYPALCHWCITHPDLSIPLPVDYPFLTVPNPHLLIILPYAIVCHGTLPHPDWSNFACLHIADCETSACPECL